MKRKLTSWHRELTREPRLAGREGEARAEALVVGWLTGMGHTPKVQRFRILVGDHVRGDLRGERPYPAGPYELTGSGRAEGPPLLLEDPEAQDLAGRVVITSLPVRGRTLRKLKEKGALGFVAIRSPKGELARPVVAEEVYRDLGPFPGVSLDYEQAMGILDEKRLLLVKEERVRPAASRNILVRLGEPGGVLVCAHLDSVPGSPGSLDNAGGSVVLLWLAERLAGVKPKVGITLAWFGAEERGLLGSKHLARWESFKLVINLDVVGDAFGVSWAVVTGPQEMAEWVRGVARRAGIPIKVKRGIYSSDQMPFAKKGTPGVSLAQRGPGGFFVHTREDVHPRFSPDRALALGELALAMLEELDRGPLPEWKVPQDTMREVEDYFAERVG